MPPRSAYPLPTGGFTLIELLVVVAILSAASLLAFGVFAEDRSQIRYDDTRQRLQILYRAILGRNGPAAGSDIAAGFVADNGSLPSDLATLIEKGSLQARTVTSPVLDPKPDDTSCMNDASSDDITVPGSAAQLVKGHAGDYLGGLAVNSRFRDGWGNVSSTDDATNFGWAVTPPSTTPSQLTITSLGMDNATGGSDFAQESALTVTANDWLVPISGWTVQVKNQRTTDIPANMLSLSLLVYKNQTGGGKWLRYATVALPTCLGAGTGCTASASLTFTDGCKPGEIVTNKGRIPQGRHLLIVTHNGADITPWTTDDKLSDATYLPTPILTQVDVVAGRNLPAVMLEIR